MGHTTTFGYDHNGKPTSDGVNVYGDADQLIRIDYKQANTARRLDVSVRPRRQTGRHGRRLCPDRLATAFNERCLRHGEPAHAVGRNDADLRRVVVVQTRINVIQVLLLFLALFLAMYLGQYSAKYIGWLAWAPAVVLGLILAIVGVFCAVMNVLETHRWRDERTKQEKSGEHRE